MNIYTKELYYNDELAEITQLTNIDTREKKYLLSVQLPTTYGLVEHKLPIKASSLDDAFNKINETIEGLKNEIKQEQQKAQLITPNNVPNGGLRLST